VRRETARVFERFTDRARRVVVLAQEEARLLDHNYIGTEHILLGLLHEGEGVAATALARLDVTQEAARVEVEAIIGRGDRQPSGHIPFTPRAKKVLEFSLREALQLGHNYIGTEHILLGLLREGEGVAAQVLTKLGVSLERVRALVVQLLSSEGLGDVGVAQGGMLFRDVARTQRVIVGGPREGCIFCGRDAYEVERIVANDVGVLLCKDCAWLAVQTMERATEPTAPVRPLRLPPRVFGSAPGDDAAREITERFEKWGGDTPLDVAVDVEGGNRLLAVQEELQARYGGGRGPQVTFSVARIRFVAPNEAAVRFTLSALPGQSFDGRAVRIGDRWCIGRETYCMIAALGGVACPPDPAAEPDWTDEPDDDDAA
jgi:hypothetical protein